MTDFRNQLDTYIPHKSIFERWGEVLADLSAAFQDVCALGSLIGFGAFVIVIGWAFS